MSITIEVSERTEKKIRRKAEATGLDVEVIVRDLLEEAVEERIPDEDSNEGPRTSPFEPFIAMGSSGKTDTSVRYKQILIEEIDDKGGFGGS